MRACYQAGALGALEFPEKTWFANDEVVEQRRATLERCACTCVRMRRRTHAHAHARSRTGARHPGAVRLVPVEGGPGADRALTGKSHHEHR